MSLFDDCLFRLQNNAYPISQIITHIITDYTLSVSGDILFLLMHCCNLFKFTFRIVTVSKYCKTGFFLLTFKFCAIIAGIYHCGGSGGIAIFQILW